MDLDCHGRIRDATTLPEIDCRSTSSIHTLFVEALIDMNKFFSVVISAGFSM